MIRRALARLVLRLIGPELRTEAKRIATAEANYAGAVALTITERKLAEAITRLTNQDVQTLDLVTEAFATRDQRLAAIEAALQGRAEALPGEAKPARDPAGFDVIPAKKLN